MTQLCEPCLTFYIASQLYQGDPAVSGPGDLSVDSADMLQGLWSGEKVALHHASLSSLSYPVKERVNPPSI